MIETYAILVALSLVFTLIAAYFSINSWRLWKESDFDTIKAKVFLDKSFLDYNFKLSLAVVWIVGGLISLHSIMEYIELYGRSIPVGFYNVYYGVLPVAMLSLVLVTYLWFRLLSKHSKKLS